MNLMLFKFLVTKLCFRKDMKNIYKDVVANWFQFVVEFFVRKLTRHLVGMKKLNLEDMRRSAMVSTQMFSILLTTKFYQ